jgi:7 transmembrane receptor (rhodopsin family)
MYTFADREHSVCIFGQKDGYSHHSFQIAFFATSYVIPLLLICGLYLCMLMRLWRGVAPGGRVSAESRRGKKRVTRMVIIVVVIFAVCWCPIQLVLVLKSLDLFEITPLNVMIQITSHVLAYMNSCVNPILYAFLSDNFRKAFRKVVYCKAFPFAASANTLVDQRANNGQPNNNAESDMRQPLCTATNDVTHMTHLKSTIVHARDPTSNGNGLDGENEAVDIL